MSFTEISLGELSSMKYGKMPKKDILLQSDDGYPVFSGYRVTGYAKEYLYEDPMLIVVARGVGGTGDVKISPPHSWITNLSIVLDLNEKLADKQYLKYKLNREHLKEKLNTGAAQAQITIENLSPYRISIPSLDEQKRISCLLSTYDDLIENNRRRIQLLEQAARLLYKEWFVHLRFPVHEYVKIVDGVPEGWERRTLGEIVEVRKGKNITRDAAKDVDVPVVAGGLKPAYYHDRANAAAPVITVSASGANAGYVNLYHEEIWASDCSYVSRDFTGHLYFFYLLLISKQKEIFGMQKGAAQPHVYPKDLKRLPIIFPPELIVKLFEDSVGRNFQMMGVLLKQNKSLVQARDLLLPRLMNGEIAV